MNPKKIKKHEALTATTSDLWKITENGIAYTGGKNAILGTGNYENFELWFEWKGTGKAGLGVRSIRQADIVSFGGEVKTFEVSVNPNQLINYGITSLELYDAIAKSNINVGGDVITKSSQAYVVRGIGLINDLEELRNIVVKNINGTPILVKNLADVRESCLPRLGQVGRMDEDDVVEGIVVMRKGQYDTQ